MHDLNVDKELKSGVISSEVYKNMLGAEIYGTATPMQWLIAKLVIIHNVIKSGNHVKFNTGNDSGVLDSEKKYFEWCEKNFPSAYNCIK